MSNKKKREDWPKRYGRGERFSDETVAKIKDGFIARRKQVDVARELGVSARNVRKYYGFFLAEGVERDRAD